MDRDTLHPGKHCDAGHGDRVNVGPECNQGWLGLIGERKSIIEASYEKESVNAGTPFVVIAKAHDWLLRFFHADGWTRHDWIIKLSHVSTFCFVVLDLQISGVLR